MPTSEQKVSMAVQEQAADYYLALQDGTMTGAGCRNGRLGLRGLMRTGRLLPGLKHCGACLKRPTKMPLRRCPHPIFLLKSQWRV